MYNYGLVQFLQAKKLKSKECIDKFLLNEGITNFTSKNHNRVNNYIQKNWVKFAAFCDKGIKSGELNGEAVKLNHYFDQQKERKEIVSQEFNSLNLSKEENWLISLESYDWSYVQSYLGKNGLKSLPNDSSFTSKKLQRLPTLRLIPNVEECIEYVKQKIKIENYELGKEAKTQAQKGIKVTHTYFGTNEYLTMKGNIIVFEDDVEIFAQEWMQGKSYLLDNWSYYKE